MVARTEFLGIDSNAGIIDGDPLSPTDLGLSLLPEGPRRSLATGELEARRQVVLSLAMKDFRLAFLPLNLDPGVPWLHAVAKSL